MLKTSILTTMGGSPPNYIEDVFSTYLYTGTGASLTITNNIDLSGKGGLVWLKKRSATGDNVLFDTVRGATNRLWSNLTLAQAADAQSLTSFNNNGFSLGTDSTTNGSAATLASWTFRKQPKFFDVVTWTGNGVAGRQISHALGSVPGAIILKCTSTAGEPWYVYHRSLGATKRLTLNTTDAETTSSEPWYNTAPTDTYFTVDQYSGANGSGKTYVAYIFAHDAGGFGLTGTDNVISCGSYTGNGSTTGPTVTLGYEPQWVMVKNTTTTGTTWRMFDNMRGFTADGSDNALAANSSAAETTYTAVAPTSTGFRLTGITSDPNRSGDTYIYIAIRRGPMKVPTDGTKVFQVYNAGDTTVQTTGFPVDMFLDAKKAGNALNTITMSRLIGPALSLVTSSTAAESGGAGNIGTAFQNNTTFKPGIGFDWWSAFGRAPNFFDEVCYAGSGANRTLSHNLGVAPELMIVKMRDNVTDWIVYPNDATKKLRLNLTAALVTDSTVWNNTAPTSSVFTVGTDGEVNQSNRTFVAYLFATCAGVSKVGSYTGTGATLDINCGFTGGARFVLIKRTDSADNWYVWDTARGMVAGTDPSLALNSTAAESNANSIYTTTGGFQILASPARNINGAGNTYIYLAIA